MQRSGRSAERDVIVLAAREPTAERDAALARRVRDALDWQHVSELAKGHGVAPLLARSLRVLDLDAAVPPAHLMRLQALAVASELKTTAMLGELAGILGAFHTGGVEALVLKGPALASTLYAEPGLRPFNDLDLLCRPGDVAPADAVLSATGYTARVPEARDQDDFHIVYDTASRPKGLELHTDLLQLGVPTRCGDALWQAPATFAIGAAHAATQGLMLCPEHQVLHLSVHLHTHGYTRLIWFKDLDLLLRRHGAAMDWEAIWALAAADGTTVSLRHALERTHALLETPLPAGATRPPRDALAEAAHALLWPRERVLRLESKQRLRSLRFNPRQGPLGVLPSLVVMGRRREKLARLMRRTVA